jgi:hypothetical protein
MEGDSGRPTSSESRNSSSKSLSGAAEPTFLSDFILVSEFSELEGPVPLFTVPEGSQSNFNVNNFVLRVMAVDYQNKSSDISKL